MKLIIKIAKTELRNLFFSPVAWFLTIIFLVICGSFYSGTLVETAISQDSLVRTTPSFEAFNRSFTEQIIMSSGTDGFMGNTIAIIYLFIPLLTMGLINRDFNSGTIKLYYSSPIKLHTILWGKYLAIMIYNLLLLSIIFMIMVAASFSIKNIDWALMSCGLIAFLLMVSCYTAIGLFMSSITNYSIVAAIGTFSILAVLGQIGKIWQEYDVFRDITYFLSIEGRGQQMLKGLITTRDVLYFVLITLLFIAFTYLSLKHGKEIVSRRKKMLRYLGVIVCVCIVGYFSSRPGYIGYWDATRTQKNTINQKTQDILAKMQDEPLEVTLYSNLLDNKFAFTRPSARNHYIWDFWDMYVRFKPNIKFNYVHFYDIKDGDSSLYKFMPGIGIDSIAFLAAKMHKANLKQYLKPAAIRNIIDLDAENMRSIMHLKYKGKSIFLRTYPEGRFWPLEKNVAAALKRLSTDTVPKLYVSTGNWERSILKSGEREYYYNFAAKENMFGLINNGFEVDTINLNFQDIPEDASALVIADPKTDLSAPMQTRIRNFIEKGGNILFNGEPGKQQVLNPVLQQLGAELMPGSLVNITKNETPEKLFAYMSMDYTKLIAANSSRMDGIRKDFNKSDSTKIRLDGAAAVSYQDSGFTLNRLWVSSPPRHVWAKLGHLVLDSAAPVMDVAQGDYRLDTFNVAIALNRAVNNTSQRIVVSGDADYFSNQKIGSTEFTGKDYLSWMVHESFPIDIVSIQPIDNLLLIKPPAAKRQKLVFVWVLPGITLLAGIILLNRRRKK